MNTRPASRRDKQIGLTEAGARFAQIYIEPAMNAEKRALTALDERDRDMMFTLIDHYATLLNEAMETVRLPDPATFGGPEADRLDRRRAGRRHRLTQASPKTREDKER